MKAGGACVKPFGFVRGVGTREGWGEVRGDNNTYLYPNVSSSCDQIT